MPKVSKYIDKFSLNLEDNMPFDLCDSNDFIISKVINEISTSTKKNIFFVTKDLKRCSLIIEYIEEIWNKKAFYLDSVILNSENNKLDKRHKLLNTLHFLEKENGKIKFIENHNLFSAFQDEASKDKLLIDINKTKLDRDGLIKHLENLKYKKNDFTEKLGDYSVRGSIVDVFTPSFISPIRIEFLKDQINTINTFNIENERRQRENLSKLEIVSLNITKKNTSSLLLLDHIKDSIIFTDADISPDIKEEKIKRFNLENKIIQIDPIKINSSTERYECKVEPIKENINDSISDLLKFINKKENHYQITIVSNKNNIENLQKDLPKKVKTLLLNGFLRKSFILKDSKEIYLSFNPSKERNIENIATKKYAQASFKLSGFNDLKKGDLVVHKDYGLCRFNGIKNKAIDKLQVDFIECEFTHNDLLLIPIDRITLIQKYIGLSENKTLDTLRTKAWDGKVKKARKMAETTAREILSLYAQRKSVMGYSFKINNNEISNFEDTFEFEETIDQKNAIIDTYKDMQNTMPMDRLICGDVGFGKTEIALRASYLSSMNMKQTAIIAPTTLLAHQHLKTFKERFEKFPVRIEGVTRFTKKSELTNIIKDSSNGKIDILIGTHKIFSKDIVLRNLGLIIIDEEHKFGVSDKEKIKQLKKGIDSLSISATPIPRTLQLSLSGLREISLLATPPKERLSIETYIDEFDVGLIKEAIEYELRRNGKVFFVHNEIKTIEKIYLKIKKLLPKITIEFIHGGMKGDLIEKRLRDFVDGNIHVLITTTIVEAGLDIQDANTMIINNAHKFGLSDLYQLRGRIGRGNKKGKAYLLIPNKEISDNAKKRLNAIQKLKKLGSGFNIAMEDLEIRGAGNLFGTKQSGNIYDVGIDFYLELLEKEINKVKNNSFDENIDVEIVYNQNINIPQSYIESPERRLFYYKKISLISDKKDSIDLIEELLDKFGPIPKPLQNLINISLIRIQCQKKGINKVIIKEKFIVIFIKEIENIKNLKLQINNLNTEPKEITKFLEETSDIKKLLKSNCEIIDGKFILDIKQNYVL